MQGLVSAHLLLAFSLNREIKPRTSESFQKQYEVIIRFISIYGVQRLSRPTANMVCSTTSGLLLRLPLPFFLHLFQHAHRILGSNEYPLFGTS